MARTANGNGESHRNHVRNRSNYPEPGVQPKADAVPLHRMEATERGKLVRMPELKFLRHRLPGETDKGWK